MVFFSGSRKIDGRDRLSSDTEAEKLNGRTVCIDKYYEF